MKKLTDEEIKKDYESSIKACNIMMIVFGTMTVILMGVVWLIPKEIQHNFCLTFIVSSWMFMFMLMQRNTYKHCFNCYFKKRKLHKKKKKEGKNYTTGLLQES